jgi:rhomboid protease GluP
MIYETALIWVVISAGYWGLFLLRRRAYPTLTFPMMMLAAAALSALGLLGQSQDTAALAPVGAVGLGAGACLLVIGPLSRRLARRANQAEHWSLARALYEVADVLAPGTGAREEKRLAAAFAEIHAGHVDEAISALRIVRDRAPPPAHRAIDEHITMIYMTAWRWAQAIEHAEATLLRSAGGSEAATRSMQVREVSASLWVELIGAYGRVGDLDSAASMLEAFEAEMGEQPQAAPLIHRARLVFLAMCGQLDAVRTLAAPSHARHMRKAARRYWVGVAAERAGQRDVATAELQHAVAASRGRSRRMAQAALEACPGSTPAELSAEATAVAEHAARRPVPTWRVPPQPWLTWIWCAACAAVALAMSAFGDAADVGTLVRSGAVVRTLVTEGQWWRLATAVFVHVGVVHVVVNLIGLWVIGRLAEETFGKLRAAFLFAACGVAGAAASYLGASAGISAGASGAIVGLLGAVLGEFTFHRAHFAGAVRNGMWGALVVVVVATLAVGSQVPEIDQWAHVAGLLCGLLLGQVVSPRHRVGRHAALLAWPGIAAFVGVLAWGGWSVARTDFAAQMLGGPWRQAAVGELQVEVPARWQIVDGELTDPDVFIVLSASIVLPTAAAPASNDQPASVGAWLDGEPARATERTFTTVRPAARAVLQLPQWQSREWELTAADAIAGAQRFRVVSFGRSDGDRMIIGSLYAPQSLFDADAASLSRVIASLRASPAP